MTEATVVKFYTHVGYGSFEMTTYPPSGEGNVTCWKFGK